MSKPKKPPRLNVDAMTPETRAILQAASERSGESLGTVVRALIHSFGASIPTEIIQAHRPQHGRAPKGKK